MPKYLAQATMTKEGIREVLTKAKGTGVREAVTRFAESGRLMLFISPLVSTTPSRSRIIPILYQPSRYPWQRAAQGQFI